MGRGLGGRRGPGGAQASPALTRAASTRRHDELEQSRDGLSRLRRGALEKGASVRQRRSGSGNGANGLLASAFRDRRDR